MCGQPAALAELIIELYVMQQQRISTSRSRLEVDCDTHTEHTHYTHHSGPGSTKDAFGSGEAEPSASRLRQWSK